jgi:hypothetical protein
MEDQLTRLKSSEHKPLVDFHFLYKLNECLYCIFLFIYNKAHLQLRRQSIIKCCGGRSCNTMFWKIKSGRHQTRMKKPTTNHGAGHKNTTRKRRKSSKSSSRIILEKTTAAEQINIHIESAPDTVPTQSDEQLISQSVTEVSKMLLI